MKAIEPTLRARGIVVGYANRPPVLDHVDIDVLDGELTVIVGPNACGKSTLLRSLARVLALRGGRVLLDGQDIRAMNQKGVARRLGLLPQSPQAPDDMLVEELVGRGRYPYQSLVRQWSEADDDAVERAMADAGVAGLAAVGAAKSMGAEVFATDVRPETAEQVESMGGTFVHVRPAAGDQGVSSDGYAKETSEDYNKRAAELYEEPTT